MTHTLSAESLNLRYDKQAENWDEALPIGNASTGAMIFGTVEKEHIQFNDQTLWLGDEINMGSYQPFGDLFIDFGHRDFSDYSRSLDINNSLHTVRYQCNGTIYTREAFASHPDGIVSIRLTADKPSAISCTVSLTDMHHGVITAATNNITSSGRLENGLEYEAQAMIILDGGTIEQVDQSLKITGANSLHILLVTGTNFANSPKQHWRGENPHKQIIQRLSAATSHTYDQLKSRHIADYSELFSRVSFELESAEFDQPTDQRLIAYGKGAKDLNLESLLFQYGRYLMISSSRPGSLPANLQGIWNQDIKPAWYSGYTTDINIEMNYWVTEPTNLTECNEPLFTWIHNLAFVRKKGEQPAIKTDKGWYIYSTNNPMGGNSTWGLHRPGSAWLSQHLWTHYEFTGDKEFLRTIAYPILKEVCEFWESELTPGPDGKLISPRGWSPEHGPDGKEGDRTPRQGVSYDQQIVWDLFSNTIFASNELANDPEFRQKLEAMRSNLLGPQIGKWGQLQEWMEDVDSPTNKHRHTSHLFAVHPGRQITPSQTPELAKAAAVSLDARGDVSTGWSTAWKVNLWARLGDGNRAHKVLGNLITPITRKGDGHGGLYLNLLCAHPPFQIDGNFGATSGLTEMLLQSHLHDENGYILQLLPALPDAWPGGKITGLRARGGFELSLEWKNAHLTQVTIKSLNGNPCSIRYGNSTKILKLAKGELITFTGL